MAAAHSTWLAPGRSGGVEDDGFRFVYQPLAGNAVIVAHVASQQSQSAMGWPV